MKAVDTHIHLDKLADVQKHLDEARQAGISRWIVPGVNPENWPSLLNLAESQRNVYIAPGIHPQAANRCSATKLDELRNLLLHPKAIAVGEVGLDRQVAAELETQEQVFIEMVRLAKETRKPLLIHTRKVTERTLELLWQEKASQVGGIFHAFSGSIETARKIVDLGFALGIGGVITWPTAKKLPEVVANISAEALVLETDAPFMAPAPYRGERNRPAYLVEVIKRVATIKGWSNADAVKVTTANASRILNLPMAENQ
jgi:TatD DNase family protein